MVNAPLCSSLSLFLYLLCQPYIFSRFCRKFVFFLLSALFMERKLRYDCHTHRTAMQVYGPRAFILKRNRSGS